MMCLIRVWLSLVSGTFPVTIFLIKSSESTIYRWFGVTSGLFELTGYWYACLDREWGWILAKKRDRRTPTKSPVSEMKSSFRPTFNPGPVVFLVTWFCDPVLIHLALIALSGKCFWILVFIFFILIILFVYF